MKPSQQHEAIRVPVGYPTAAIYIDESGVAGNERFFVVGALKVRRPGELARAVKSVRERTGFDEEFRWNRASLGKLPAYFAMLDELAGADARFAACIVDRHGASPFKPGQPFWQGHAIVTAQLLRGCINKRELVCVSMDVVDTPAGVSFEEEVKTLVNRHFRNTSVVGAQCLDSRSTDLLQVVDVLTGAVAFEQRLAVGQSGRVNSHKGKVAQRVKSALGVDSLLCRTGPVNVQVFRGPTVARTRPARSRPLRAARSTSSGRQSLGNASNV